MGNSHFNHSLWLFLFSSKAKQVRKGEKDREINVNTPIYIPI